MTNRKNLAYSPEFVLKFKDKLWPIIQIELKRDRFVSSTKIISRFADTCCKQWPMPTTQ